MPAVRALLLILVVLFIAPQSVLASSQKHNEAAAWNNKGITALEQNDYREAISCFQQALHDLPEDKTIRKNLATAYNNYAIYLDKNNDHQQAKKYLQQSLELDPLNINYRKNLSQIMSRQAAEFFHNGDYELSIDELQESIVLDKQNISSFVLLGQVYYQMQELSLAESSWEKALKHDPENKDLKQKLDRLRKEIKVENGLKHLDADHFDIRFDEDIIDSEAYDIRGYLREAYRGIGKNLNYYPPHKIPIIFYSEEDFRKLRQTPEWIKGIYDGKIRLPAKKGQLLTSEFKKIIWHEYTHAIVFYLTDGRCPVWFNEGLAVYEESKVMPPNLKLLQTAVSQNRLIPLNELNSIFSESKDLSRLTLAYLEAYTFIEYLLDRWNMYVIKSILEGLKQGKTIEDALSRETYLKPAQLEDNWRQFIQRRYCQ